MADSNKQGIIPNSKEILLNILTIIDYKNDKEAFAKEFLTVMLQEAFSNVIASLSGENKADLEKKLSNNLEDKEIYQLFQQYLTPQEYVKVFFGNISNFIKEYLQEIRPLISETQRNELDEYIAGVGRKFEPQKN